MPVICIIFGLKHDMICWSLLFESHHRGSMQEITKAVIKDRNVGQFLHILFLDADKNEMINDEMN